MKVGYFLLCAVMGVLGGMGVGVMHAAFEHFWYHTLDWLHRRGHIQRLAPSIAVKQNQYHKESFWATAIGPIPVSAAGFYFRNGFISRCQVSGDIVGSLLFTWTVMVLHDAYFFAVHTVMHYFKSLYKRVHQWHHATNGDLTVFNTAYGDILDITFTFAPFYAALVAYIYCQPTWNPVDVLFLMWAVNGVDMTGHCGYMLPLWVYAPGSMGVLLTPLAHRPKHHYIHHLDPRYNRSLYFTWWDRLAGSFREDHPKLRMTHPPLHVVPRLKNLSCAPNPSSFPKRQTIDNSLLAVLGCRCNNYYVEDHACSKQLVATVTCEFGSAM